MNSTLNRFERNATRSDRPIRATLIRSFTLMWFLIAAANAWGLSERKTFAMEPVSATLETESAWTGQPVRLIVMLYSPGPFSGVASFDLPDVPQMVFLRGGSPVVGNETVEGVAYFTQRHELTIYTQRSGVIEVPAFRVRFFGKKTFTSDPEPMSGQTEWLTFTSKRPPGSEEMGFVLAASEMETSQTFAPAEPQAIDAGDVIERAIRRVAKGTTAMMMPPIDPAAPKGVRVYSSDPIVEDRSARGVASATRSETFKYQFSEPGTFTLPDVKIIWWDTREEKLKFEVLEGKTVNVRGSLVEANSGSDLGPGKPSNAELIASAIALAVLVALAWLVVGRFGLPHSDSESQAAYRVLAACERNDAERAYADLFAWSRHPKVVTAVDQGTQRDVTHPENAFERELRQLRFRLFSGAEEEAAWCGDALAREFSDYRKQRLRSRREAHGSSVLPGLNAPGIARG